MANEIVKTGFLNYTIDLNKVKAMDSIHPLKSMMIAFKPKDHSQKSFMAAYKRFLSYMNKNQSELLKYGFIAETVSSEAFGTKTFYKSQFESFFYSELFEAYHLGLI